MCTSTQLAQWYSHIPYRCDGTLTRKVYQHSISIYAGHQLRRFSKNPKNNQKLYICNSSRWKQGTVVACRWFILAAPTTHGVRRRTNPEKKQSVWNGCKGGCNKSINRCIAAFQIVPFLFRLVLLRYVETGITLLSGIVSTRLVCITFHHHLFMSHVIPTRSRTTQLYLLTTWPPLLREQIVEQHGAPPATLVLWKFLLSLC